MRKVVYGFVSLDSIALEPHFRLARQSGSIPEAWSWTRACSSGGSTPPPCGCRSCPPASGLGSDVVKNDPTLKTVTCPYADGEELLAVPALNLDAAFVHLNRADERGNAQFLGPDLYFDDLFLGAAAESGRRFLSCEKVVPTADLLANGSFHTMKINRSMVDGVIEAPNGAHFTELPARLRARRGVPEGVRQGRG